MKESPDKTLRHTTSISADMNFNVKLIICLSMESIRLGGPAEGIVTKTVQKTLPRGGGGPWGRLVGSEVVA